MAKKTNSMNFQINLEFVTKAKNELNNYVDKIKEIQSLSDGRLGSQFGKTMLNDISRAVKGLNTLSKAMNDPSLKKGEKFKLINITGQDLAQLQTAIKGLENYWKTELKNSAEASKNLDDLLEKRKQLTSVKSKITRNSNKAKAAEDELKNLGYQGGTTQRDKDAIASAIKNKTKLLKSQKEQGLLDNKELEQEIELLKAQEKEIKKIIDSRKTAIDLGKEVKNLSAVGGVTGTSDPETATKRLDREITKASSLTEEPEIAEKIANGYRNIANEAQYLENSGGSAISNFTSGARAELQQLSNEEEELRQTTQSLKQVLASFGIGFSAVTIANYFRQLASEAFNFYRSLDEALTSIRVVSNLTSEAVQDLKSDFITMSKESGMAIDDITKSAVLFYQQGLDTSAVLEMTEVTAQFAKVAGIDATDAADKLTAAVNGYCLGAEDAALVADKFNKVAAASAADIDELSTAFSKAAAQANQAGVSMDNYLAYIATMEEATREAPENIGTSLKTIFSRMEQIKTAGSSEDGETDVNAVETALRTVGIQLRNSENQLRDLEDVLDELGGKWQSLDINTQAYLGTVIAGTRQQSRFITLMQNWDRVLQLSEDSQNSAGQQALMHQKAMESLDTAVQQLTNAWQTFLSNLTDSKALKNLLKVLTGLLNLINKGNAPVAVLGAAIGVLSKHLSKLGKPLLAVGKNFKNFGKAIKTIGTKSFSKDLGALKTDMENANMEVEVSKDVYEKYSAELIDVRAKLKNLTVTTEEDKAAKEELEAQEAILTQKVKESGAAYEEAGRKAQGAAESYNMAANSLNTVMSATTAAIGIVTVLVSLFGKADDTSGQVAIGLTMLAGAAAIAFAAIKMGINKTTAALAANPIGAIITAITMAITGLITVISSLVNASENMAKKMNEAVSEVGDKLDSVTTAKTAINQVEKLKARYDELSNKVYLTQVEQQELNDTIQELGDTYDLDVMTDKYGNLSISIAEVNERLAEEKEELAELNDELTKAEKQGYKDNKFQANAYYDKLFAKERSSYKTLLSGIDADVDVDDLRASSMEIENVNIELKNAIMDNAEEMAYWLGKEGVAISDYIININNNLNSAIDDDAWEDYYNMLGQLGDDVNNLDYGQVQDKLDSFFATFQKQCGLTTEQVNLLREAMNDTLYADSSLDETIKALEDSIDKQAILMEKQKQIDEKYKNHWYNYLADTMPILQQIDMTFGTNMTASQRTLHKAQAERQAVKDVNGMDTSETAQLIASLERLTAASGEALGAIDAYSDLLDEEGNVLMTSQEFLEGLNIDAITNAFRDSKSSGYDELISQLADAIENTDDEELKKALQEKINDAVGQLQITAEMTWTGLGEELDTLSSKLRSMNSIMAEFSENGGISLDTFQDLCAILEDVDMESLFQTGMIDQYLESLEKLNLGFDASTGYITAEGESMQTLQNLQEALAKAQLASTIQNLKNTKASLEAELNMVEVEQQATQAAIAYLEQKGSGTVALTEIENAANEAYQTGMANAVDTALEAYTRMTKASAEWSQATIKNSGLVAEAINKAYTEGLSEDTVRDMMSSVTSGMNWEGLNSSGLYAASTDGKIIEVSAALAELKKYNSELDKTSQSIKLRIKNVDAMIVGMEAMFNSDLGKLGNEEAAAELDKYIGQLEEIYNILRKIEGVEARLNNLEDYSELAHGQAKADYLKEQIGMTEELVGLNKDLLAAQKYMENTEQQAILNSPVGDVFSFDEFGNIIIDYEKYTALQDEAANGQQTLKELADNLYEEYQDLHGTTLEYYEELVSSIEQSIDAQQELVDTYVDLETDLANAVKDIYQDMLDTKLEAINTEIEALDKLKEARDKANKAKDDSKDLSDMQTSLKRAMMDTSGASNTKVLSYQDQIKSKLEEMGEDEYTERLDAIKEALEKEQEQLQRNFDEFFEDWEQLYDLIENRILSSEEATLEVLKTTDAYLQASDAERAQMIDEWRTNHAVAMTAMQNGGTIMDVVNSIFTLRDSIPDIDALLKDDEYYSKIGSTISQALTEYYNSKADGSGSSSGSSSGGSGGNINKSHTEEDSSDKPSTKPFEDAKDALDKWSESVELAVTGWWHSLLEWVNNAASTVGNFFTQTIPNWWTEHIWNPLTNFFTVTIPGWFGTAKETISNWWTENITPLFTLEYWKEKIGNIIYNVSYALTELGLDIQDFWNAHVAKYFTAEFWKEQWDKVCTAFSNGWNSVVEFFTQTVPQWWDEHVAKFFTAEYWAGVWDGVVEGFKSGWNKVVTFFTQTIPQWWNDNIAKFFTKEYWLGVLANIKEALSGWWSGIKNWFNSTIVAWWNNNIAKFFTMEYWSNKWTQIKNGFVNGIKKVVNGIADIWNGFVDAISGMFDWLGSAWSWLTGKAKQGSSDAKKNHIPKYETGGIADFTGPAWLDGTKSAPEAVLNAAQTKAFMKLADNLDKLDISEGGLGASIQIDSISFNVESMSSKEDGEAAFDAFVNRFREIGRQTGLAMNTVRLK